MYYSKNLAGFIFLFPFILVIILYIIRHRKILKRKGLYLSDLYDGDEKWKVVQKELRKANPYYWLIILLGLILAIIVAVINEQ